MADRPVNLAMVPTHLNKNITIIFNQRLMRRTIRKEIIEILVDIFI